jgi:hypothetical protein
MKKRTALILFTAVLLLLQPEIFGQETQKHTNEHYLLYTFQGTWMQRAKLYPSPEAPPIEVSGKVKHDMILGGNFLRMSGYMEIDGERVDNLAFIGYDKRLGKFTFHAMDEMSTSAIDALGEVNERRTVLTFKGKAVNPQTLQEEDFKIIYNILNVSVHRIEYYRTDPSGLEYMYLEVDMTLSS